MMSEKQYEVACKGVIIQLRTAQKLHCKHMEQKYKEALEKLQKRFLKPDAVGCFDLGARVSNSYYHLQMVMIMGKKEYSVVEFIQYLKDKPYIKLYKAARLAEINMRREMRILRYSPFYLDRE